MNEDREFDRMARAWLELGPNEAPDRSVSAVLQAVETTPQVRPLSQRLPWRFPTMTRFPIAAAAAVAIVIVVGGFLFMRATDPTVGGPSPSTTASPSAEASAALSTSPGVAEPIPVTPESVIAITKPIGIASDGNALWVLTETGNLIRIDPASIAADPALELGAGQFTGLSADPSGVWATRLSTGLVYRVDPTTREIVATIEVDDAKGVLAAEGAVWVARDNGTVDRIDPATNEVVATITVDQAIAAPFKLVSGFGSIWVGELRLNNVVRIDPATNAVQATIPTSAGTSACILATAVDAIWNISCNRSTSLGRIDPVMNEAGGSVDLPGYGYASTVINDALWVSVEPRGGQGQGSIVRIDATTNEVDRVLSPDVDFSGYGEQMIVAGGSVWVLDYTNSQLLRLPLSAFQS